MQIRSKDFLETAEGLVFAVLVDEIEDGRHLCFLRYLKSANGFRKVATQEAKILLPQNFPRYCFHSKVRDVDLHGVRDSEIVRHYAPKQALQHILHRKNRDPIESKLVRIVDLIEKESLSSTCAGVTGSLLLGAQNAHSDIDLVIYGRDHFMRVREIVKRAIARKTVEALSNAQWREAYQRRGCSLSFDDYLWHEKRKHNKASLSGTKIDFTLIAEDLKPDFTPYRKIEALEIITKISDDLFAFDTPARYSIAHPEIAEILCFTHTFAGQAIAGETVIARGMVEESESGARRLVIGSSREAADEYLKVVANAP